MMRMKTIRKKIMRKVRIDLGMTQSQMAEALDTSLTSYSLIENGYREGTVAFWLKYKGLTGMEDSKLIEVMQDVQQKDADHCQAL